MSKPLSRDDLAVNLLVAQARMPAGLRSGGIRPVNDEV